MSEELKLDRYEVTEGGGTFKCPGGEMVYYSDVKSFIADNNAALRAELATFKAGQIEQHSAVRYVLASDYDACASRLHEVAVACANAEQERDALRAQVEAMRAALISLLTMDVNGHHLQDRLQFSTKGREILEKVNAALQAKP